MSAGTHTLFLSLALCCSVRGAGATTGRTEPPPGLVLVPGGRTRVGSTQKDIERLIEQHPALKEYFGTFAGETPQLTVDLAGFFLMATEVTNEQFAAYVTAAGARPPQHWGAEAIDRAREDFLAEEARKRADAEQADEPEPESGVFDERAWWLQNWRGKPWRIPEGLECRPVVSVDFQDAVGYARWAGLRLMTEEEFQRAVRGDKERTYPWGERWEDGKYAATKEIRENNAAYPVGSFPAGASEQGVFDLSGNVWEWTASEYTRHEGFKPFELTLGHGDAKEIVDTLPGFDADQQVVVGGSFETDRHAARGTLRRGAAPEQQTAALGFRCAASTRGGRDVALALILELEDELRRRSSGVAIACDLERTIALEEWRSEPGTCGVPGYAVISAYEHILFTPAREIPQALLAELRAASLAEAPVPMGLLALSQPAIEPALPAGAYRVAFRGMGATPAMPEAKAAPLEEVLGFDPGTDAFILVDRAGEPVAAIPVVDAEIGRSGPGSLSIVDRADDLAAGAGAGEETERSLRFEVVVPTRASRNFKATFELRFAAGVLERAWRR